ncbi:MAG: MscL family protein, partial [Clostridia bacterium]|nr:MscL family protein [Clostridia bacterium]
DFKNLAWTVGEAVIGYGIFIQNVIDFIIIALSIFLFIKLIGKFSRKKEEDPQEPPKKPDDIVLLEEIRDLLKEQKNC